MDGDGEHAYISWISVARLDRFELDWRTRQAQLEPARASRFVSMLNTRPASAARPCQLAMPGTDAAARVQCRAGVPNLLHCADGGAPTGKTPAKPRQKTPLQKEVLEASYMSKRRRSRPEGRAPCVQRAAAAAQPVGRACTVDRDASSSHDLIQAAAS
jgi:hypothetical protein